VELSEEWKESTVVPIYKKGDKTDCITITIANYVQNFVQRPALKVNSIRGGSYWGSSMWILMQQVIH